MENSKAIELIEKSERIGMVLPRDPNIDTLASVEVFWRVLEERGKIVGLLGNEAKKSVFPNLFKKVAAGSVLPKEFIVSLDTAQSPVGEMRYEKGDGRIDIVFSPKHLPIHPDTVSFREGRVRCDLLVAFGVQDLEKDAADINTPELFTQTPIINIDRSGKNQNFGEVNLLAPNMSSLAEIVYELTAALTQAPLSSELATLLFGAMVAETDHFKTDATNAETFRIASELLRLGADRGTAKKLFENQQSLPLLQLYGRAAVRSRIEENSGMVWSFVTTEDFEKTGRTERDIPEVLEHIESSFPAHRIAALLWQNPEEKVIRAILAGNRGTLESIASRGEGAFQSPHLVLTATFEDFRAAETGVRALLEGKE